MKKLVLLALFIPCLLPAQSVVVSGYFNAADPRDEWIELLVVTDNTDMRNWTIRDNNASQTAWQTAVAFNNVALWNNMRAGTIILIWNRVIASDGSTVHPVDVNKDDGYLELTAQNATYFTGGSFGSSPTWGGATLNHAGGGDVVQLRDGSAAHIHALGHITTPGTDWTALGSPKLNHAASLASGEGLFVCPGASAADYGTNAPQNGTTYTAKSSTAFSFGLPNTCTSSSTANPAYWYSLREPVMTAQTVTPSSVVPGTPGSIGFSWTTCTDPNSADNTTGYMILRNTSNSFTAPSDGTTYTVGGTLGGADILAIVTPSTTNSYTDNTVMNGNAYYYRVYAFRYTTDNLNGNSYDPSHGRAYNTTNFVQVDYPTPLPVELLSFTATPLPSVVVVNWTTATETNNDYFSVERSNGNSGFTEIKRVDGAGNSKVQMQYETSDELPLPGVSYYRLKQTDFNGQFSYSGIAPVEFKNETGNISIGMNESGQPVITATGLNPGNVSVFFYDAGGRLVLKETSSSDGFFRKELTQELGKGLYFVSVTDGVHQLSAKFIR